MGGKPKDTSPYSNNGPGSYKADYNVVKNKVITHDIGKGTSRSSLQIKDNTPGPGSYD